jgi:hypothetical protein
MSDLILLAPILVADGVIGGLALARHVVRRTRLDPGGVTLDAAELFAARLGARVAHNLSRRRIELCHLSWSAESLGQIWHSRGLLFVSIGSSCHRRGDGISGHFAAPHESGIVQGFGCRP